MVSAEKVLVRHSNGDGRDEGACRKQPLKDGHKRIYMVSNSTEIGTGNQAISVWY